MGLNIGAGFAGLLDLGYAALLPIGAFPAEPSTDTFRQTVRGADEPVHASNV
jgi:ABC-type branched-subunit amino acid transport system permease subunit